MGIRTVERIVWIYVREVSFWVDGRAGLYNAGALGKGGGLHHHGDHTS